MCFQFLKPAVRGVVWLAVGLVWPVRASAATPTGQPSPYVIIARQNLFRLKPPQSIEQPKTLISPPQIILLGIVAGPGPKQVFFKLLSADSRAGNSYALSEHESADEIEIVEIMESAGSVRVKNHGREQLLTLERDGLKPGGNAVATIPGTASRLETAGHVRLNGNAPPRHSGPPMTPEVQMINMEINRKLTAQEVDKGLLPPLPPTPMTGN